MTAREIFIPLTVGGGLRSIDDIKNVLRAGADKVSINTAAVSNPTFIEEAALRFGSSTIVVSIEAIKESNGKYFVYTDNGREHTGLEVVEWAQKVENLGAGEIVITSVDKEGTGGGYDIELTKQICDVVKIPVIAHGGASSPENIVKVIQDSGVDAVAIASILHYDYIKELENEKLDYTQEGNVSFLQSGKSFNKIKPYTLQEIRKELIKNKIPTREYVRK
jgi:cyclase